MASSRGSPPSFFDGNARAFSDLYFHIESQEFRFYQPTRMKGDPLWINVTALMRAGNAGLGKHIAELAQHPEFESMQGDFIGRLNNVLGIREIDLHVEEVTGSDKTVDVVVDIFNRVNSGGTKLSQGDLALAKICGSWPEGREHMQSILERWRGLGYDFTLDWLLRNVNGIVTGEARFEHLHDVSTAAIQDGLTRAEKAIDHALNLIADRLGLDHDRVLFGRYALPVMSRYIDQRGGHLADAAERRRLLYWYFQSAMWGRFSGSTETTLNQDFEAIEDLDRGLDGLLDRLRLWHGSLRVEPEHFRGWSLGARFYPVLYALTRVGEAKDWGTGDVLKQGMLGAMSTLEVHHIFPKSLLYKNGFDRSQVNAVANFCFLTKGTNLQISNRPPSEYFPKIEGGYPGSLASQWIPMDEALWETDNYPRFLEERQRLLAAAANELLDDLLQGAAASVGSAGGASRRSPREHSASHPRWDRRGGREGRAAGHQRVGARARAARGLHGARARASRDGRPSRILDLAWPNGLQPGYSDPVALLLGEEHETPADRERPWLPPLHKSRSLQALRGGRGVGPRQYGQVAASTHAPSMRTASVPSCRSSLT